jgi:hypothetical protein
MELKTLARVVRQNTDYQNNRQKLQEQIKTDLVLAHANSLFQITPELIAFLHAWDQDQIYVEDQFGNPILCNRTELLHEAKQHYHRTLNRWHALHEELKHARKI